jgi:hypothetical protein
LPSATALKNPLSNGDFDLNHKRKIITSPSQIREPAPARKSTDRLELILKYTPQIITALTAALVAIIGVIQGAP